MKKCLFAMMVVMVVSAVSTPVAIVEQAMAAPLDTPGCITAYEMGWENWNWNQICYYEMVALDPGFEMPGFWNP